MGSGLLEASDAGPDVAAMKQVVVNNVTYPSLAAAWRELDSSNVSFALARKRIQRGWDVLPALIEGPVPPQERRTFDADRRTFGEDVDTFDEVVQYED